MPTFPAFVDTNVLLYAASNNPAHKREAARKVLLSGPFCFSVQVAQEFFVNATRKLVPALTAKDALAFLKGINPSAVAALDYEIFEQAVRVQERFQISYWDAAILAAAKRLQCELLYSEDLSDGQDYDGVRVINPFRNVTAS